MREFHVLSLGAGVQSTTLFLMIANGLLLPGRSVRCVFADTGEEPFAVYEHLWRLAKLGALPITIRSAGKLGDDLIAGRNSTGQRFAPIPAFTTDGATVGQTKRQCTKEYKTAVCERAIRRDIVECAPGRAIPRDAEVHLYVGISLEEARRSINVRRNVESRRGWFAHPLLRFGCFTGRAHWCGHVCKACQTTLGSGIAINHALQARPPALLDQPNIAVWMARHPTLPDRLDV